MKCCPKCGKELPEDALFCNKCGYRVEKLNESQTQCSSNICKSADDVQGNDTIKKNTDNIIHKKRINRTVIYILLGLCAVILCIKGCTAYLNNQNKAIIEKYAREKHDVGVNKSSDEMDSSESSIKKFMEDMANDYNKDLPEDIGFGMIMKSCKVEGKRIVYIVEWAGMKSEDFTSEVIDDVRSSTIDGLKEDNNPFVKSLISQMKEYGYGFGYRYVNEHNEVLCDITISPNELL